MGNVGAGGVTGEGSDGSDTGDMGSRGGDRRRPEKERKLELFEVWELLPLAMMMICRTLISRTSNSYNLGSRLAREEPKKGKSSKNNFQDDGHLSSGPAVHV